MIAGVQRDTPEDVRAAEPVLLGDGWHVFVLPEGVDDAKRLFDAVVATFPLDPPLARVRDSWDALNDSLSAGLLDVPAAKIAILWPGAYKLATFEPESYEIGAEILGELREILGHGEWTNDGKPKEIAVLLGVSHGDRPVNSWLFRLHRGSCLPVPLQTGHVSGQLPSNPPQLSV